jgi:hypothetical protein
MPCAFFFSDVRRKEFPVDSQGKQILIQKFSGCRDGFARSAAR